MKRSFWKERKRGRRRLKKKRQPRSCNRFTRRKKRKRFWTLDILQVLFSPPPITPRVKRWHNHPSKNKISRRNCTETTGPNTSLSTRSYLRLTNIILLKIVIQLRFIFSQITLTRVNHLNTCRPRWPLGSSMAMACDHQSAHTANKTWTNQDSTTSTKTPPFWLVREDNPRFRSLSRHQEVHSSPHLRTILRSTTQTKTPLWHVWTEGSLNSTNLLIGSLTVV